MTATKQLEILSDKLETLVDANNLDKILEALALCCSAKADHIRTNWPDQQDEALAEYWDAAAGQLLHIQTKLSNEFDA